MSIFLRPVAADAAAPPDRRALAVWTLRRLYEGIFSGEFQPATPLVEAELTERLGVSRQPVREALRQLERDGLIEPAKGNGQRVVVAYGREHVEELYGIRAALEGVSFGNAALRITPQELERLEGIQAELERRFEERGSLQHPYDPTLDFKFHEVVCLSTGMRTLHAHLTTLWIQTWALMTQLDVAGTYPDTEDAASSYKDRRVLIEALRSGDAEHACASAKAHVKHRQAQLLEAIDAGRGKFRLEPAKGLRESAGVFV